MTEIKLDKLMHEIDAVGNLRDQAKIVQRDINIRVHDLTIEHEALMRALALTGYAASPQPSPVKEATVTEKRDTLAECIAAIRSTFIMPLDPGATDRTVQEQLKAKGYSYKRPTVCNAIKKINADSSVSGVPSPATETSPGSTAVDEPDAGSPQPEKLDDFPDIPTNLRRPSSGAAKAAAE